MPQGPIMTVVSTLGGVWRPLILGNSRELISTAGGLSTALNQTVAAVIKATPTRLCRVVIVAPGSTGGAFTFNDATTTGAAAASNLIWTLPFGASTNVAGASFDVQMPCANGLVLSAVPTGGSPIIALSYL